MRNLNAFNFLDDCTDGSMFPTCVLFVIHVVPFQTTFSVLASKANCFFLIKEKHMHGGETVSLQVTSRDAIILLSCFAFFVRATCNKW